MIRRDAQAAVAWREDNSALSLMFEKRGMDCGLPEREGRVAKGL